MRLDASELGRAGDWVGKITAKAGLPSSLAMRVETIGDRLQFFAGDSLGFHWASIGADEELGRVYLPGQLFGQYVKALKAKSVDLVGDESKIILRAGNARAEFRTLDVGPSWDIPSGDPVWTIPADELKSILTQTTYNSEKPEDDGKAWLMGVRIIRRGGVVIVRAGTRYSCNQFKISNGGPDFDLAVNARALAESVAAMRGTVRLKRTENNLIVTDDTLGCSLRSYADVGWPDMAKLWAPEQDASIDFDREQMIDILNRLSITGNRTRLIAGSETVKIESVAGMDWKSERASASDEMACEHEGDPFTLIFNADYLLRALKAMTCERARLACKIGANVATTLSASSGTGVLHVIMPLRLGE